MLASSPDAASRVVVRYAVIRVETEAEGVKRRIGAAAGRAWCCARPAWWDVYNPAGTISTVPGVRMSSPLSDVRVVEVTNFVAAPSAGAVLADFGADVVKVEPLRGDSWRGMTRPPKPPDGMPNLDYGFQIDNRGKRSVAIALDQPEGAELVRRLVAGVDVFLCNLLPHRQQRYGLDWPTLRAVNPRLVHATFTGYGMTGPDACAGLRRHRLLRTGARDRRDDRAGRSRADAPSRPG